MTSKSKTISHVKTTNPSGFDRDFYLKAYKDVIPRFIDPITHYYSVGVQQKRLPNADKFRQLYPQFDETTYANNYEDLSRFTTEELMSHYHHHGKSEGRTYHRNSSKHRDVANPNSGSGSVIPNSSSSTPTTLSLTDLPGSRTLVVPRVNKVNNTEIIRIDPPHQRYINTQNFAKIEHYAQYDGKNVMDPILTKIISKKDLTKPIYLILSEWGYPPFGGGESWLIDTTKWMHRDGFVCYYLYFSDPVTHRDFAQYNVLVHDTCTYIKFPRDTYKLLSFVSALNPAIISHQGIKRQEYMRIANLLEKPFMTGFCFWQDLIEIPLNGTEIYNQNMATKTFVPDQKFDLIHDNATSTYVASQFMADIVKDVHGVDMDVINTISDESLYKIEQPSNGLYVTVVNICGLKGGNILESIINGVGLDVPFLLVDSQESDMDLNKRLKGLIDKRNLLESAHQSIYLKGPVADMKSIYRKTKILLVPTLVDETFCRVAYEGMMNNIPILSTSNGNLKYLMRDYADILDHQPETWIDKITQVYHDDTYLQAMRHRQKTINPFDDQHKFVNMVYRSIMNKSSSYLHENSVGLLCPWADQGLGIQCREYYEVLHRLGYNVSIFSFKPYHSDKKNPKLQADPDEWEYENIYYGQDCREQINCDQFIEYLHQYRVSKMVIVETCYPKVFELARLCRLLSIQVVAIPNLETLRYPEIYQHHVFDRIICNNQMTYEILSKYFPNKANLVGFRILNKNFGLTKTLKPFNSFFCSGGLNAFTRKNIDKIISAFKELENEDKLGGFKLYIYVQGVETPTNVDKYQSDNIIFSVNLRAYKEIVELYKNHDIFIHMGDHEGLGLGFYESIVCGTPVFTIDTPPNNEIIREGINGWLVKCSYTPLTDNKEGIVHKALLTVPDLKAKMYEIITHYHREQMYRSTIMDYIKRYPVESYLDQIKRMFS
jgi:glycosyltransferase involved in cell wall biosynthesis